MVQPYHIEADVLNWIDIVPDNMDMMEHDLKYHAQYLQHTVILLLLIEIVDDYRVILENDCVNHLIVEYDMDLP
jgi:hypothetical protein